MQNQRVLIIFSFLVVTPLGYGDPFSGDSHRGRSRKDPSLKRKHGSENCHLASPRDPFVKLNSDASLSADSGSIGGILRLNDGHPLASYSLNCYVAAIQDLEIDAIHTGIQLARDLHIQSLWIESDSQIAVNVILNKIPCPWKKMLTLETIKANLEKFHSWEITHIWREGNRAVDFLSKSDCPCKGYNIPPSVFPFVLDVIIVEDFSGVPFLRL
ncbi:uncharacterized protein LOC143849537 [Tasmannia lanceolata]|uniref:uncharacterized protein LOC143849537 n=1 Tax=Tasmannia lanceolata TaxID=3420 RepID=UPI004063CB55